MQLINHTILTADICNEYTQTSNITWLNVAGVKFDFKGDGIVSAGGADSTSGYRAGDGWFYVTIVYKSAGKISLYCINRQKRACQQIVRQ